jgi:biotin-(acetyl-CoA carboxylase) ligase
LEIIKQTRRTHMTENPFEAPRDPSFPPLFQAQEVSGPVDPFDKARAMASLGCDAGVLVYSITSDRLRAAIVFAPEIPLKQAMQAFCACATGFQNAFGALAPPEVAMHLTWEGEIMINGATCGQLQAAASDDAANSVPDWLVIGLEVWLIPQREDEPGNTPHLTSLYMEGCADVSPLELLEGWARHSLVWVNELIVGDAAALHGEWRELLHGVGSDLTLDVAGQTKTGTFLGTDADFSLLLRTETDTCLIPLTNVLKQKDTA